MEHNINIYASSSRSINIFEENIVIQRFTDPQTEMMRIEFQKLSHVYLWRP